MYVQYGKVIEKTSNPQDITVNSFFNILKQTDAGFSISQLCKTACEENKQISEYLGNKWTLQNNHKLKSVIDILINRHDIKIIQQKPLVLQYILLSEEKQKNIVNESDKGNENICGSDYLDSNSKSLSDVYDVYDVNNNNRIINQPNSIQQYQYPNNNNAFIVILKIKLRKLKTLKQYHIRHIGQIE